MKDNYSFENTPYMLYKKGIDPVEKLEKGLEFKKEISNFMISSAIKQGGFKVVEDNELKFKISNAAAEVLKQKLSLIMSRDKFAYYEDENIHIFDALNNGILSPRLISVDVLVNGLSK